MTLKEFAAAGGKARQKGLTARERSELGRKAARARWQATREKVAKLKDEKSAETIQKLSH